MTNSYLMFIEKIAGIVNQLTAVEKKQQPFKSSVSIIRKKARRPPKVIILWPLSIT